jgi:hypothetical protein
MQATAPPLMPSQEPPGHGSVEKQPHDGLVPHEDGMSWQNAAAGVQITAHPLAGPLKQDELGVVPAGQAPASG